MDHLGLKFPDPHALATFVREHHGPTRVFTSLGWMIRNLRVPLDLSEASKPAPVRSTRLGQGQSQAAPLEPGMVTHLLGVLEDGFAWSIPRQLGSLDLYTPFGTASWTRSVQDTARGIVVGTFWPSTLTQVSPCQLGNSFEWFAPISMASWTCRTSARTASGGWCPP